MNDFFRFCRSLDRGNDTKLAKKLFLSNKYIILGSRQFIQKIPLTPSAVCILLAEGEGHCELLERQEKKRKRRKVKNMKNTNV